MKNLVGLQTIDEAAQRLNNVAMNTPLQFSHRLSKLHRAKVYLKREDLQDVRSYKIRGAYNLIKSLPAKEQKKGVVCASAGNHAQGVAYSCNRLKIKGTIFMPVLTPLQKISRVRHFGSGWVDVKLVGTTFDESNSAAQEFSKKHSTVFVHPFDDPIVISGQGTVGKEIWEKLGKSIDYLFCPVGGGGLISGAGTYLKGKNKKVKVVAVEAKGAAGMHKSLKFGSIVTLEEIDPFVDGVAVKTVGSHTFAIASKLIDKTVVLDEGQICSTMIDLYQNEGIVSEPAGALSISALDELGTHLKNKVVVCILSGGNNDILRYPEIMEKSLVYKGLKHYFIIEFAQRPGQLKKLVDKVLGPSDDIVRFEYIKKNSKETGPALVGIELVDKKDLRPLMKKLDTEGINYTALEPKDLLYKYLI
ncbi:threonine ammonia-lyase IlvA [Candidatus Saccharibacteria bacterium]|nr:threonine ammonia-lyase IlvA [Candidatus Saccharibacteria bacterium]